MHIKFAHLAALAALAIPVLAVPLEPSDLTAPDAALGLARREPSGSGSHPLPKPPAGSKPGKTYPGGHKPPKNPPAPRPKPQPLPLPKGPHPLPRPPKNHRRSTDLTAPDAALGLAKREPSGSGSHPLPKPPAGSKPGRTYPGGHKPPKNPPAPRPKPQPLPLPKGPHPLPRPPKNHRRSTDEAI